MPILGGKCRQSEKHHQSMIVLPGSLLLYLYDLLMVVLTYMDLKPFDYPSMVCLSFSIDSKQHNLNTRPHYTLYCQAAYILLPCLSSAQLSCQGKLTNLLTLPLTGRREGFKIKSFHSSNHINLNSNSKISPHSLLSYSGPNQRGSV